MNPLYSLTIIDSILPAFALLASFALAYGFWVFTIHASFGMQILARVSGFIIIAWFSFVNLFIWGMVGI
jgi:hypothetical protein